MQGPRGTPGHLASQLTGNPRHHTGHLAASLASAANSQPTWLLREHLRARRGTDATTGQHVQRSTWELRCQAAHQRSTTGRTWSAPCTKASLRLSRTLRRTTWSSTTRPHVSWLSWTKPKLWAWPSRRSPRRTTPWGTSRPWLPWLWTSLIWTTIADVWRPWSTWTTRTTKAWSNWCRAVQTTGRPWTSTPNASFEAGVLQLSSGIVGVHTTPAQPEEAADQDGRAACRGVEACDGAEVGLVDGDHVGSGHTQHPPLR